MSVVLPEPDGPMMAIHSPAATSKLTSSRARTAPKLLETFPTSTSGVIVIGSFAPQNLGRPDASQKPERQSAGKSHGQHQRQRSRPDHSPRRNCRVENAPPDPL